MCLDRSTNLQRQRELHRIQGLDGGKRVMEGGSGPHVWHRSPSCTRPAPPFRAKKNLQLAVDLVLVGIVWPDGDAVDESRMLGAAFGGDGWEVRGRPDVRTSIQCVRFQINRDGHNHPDRCEHNIADRVGRIGGNYIGITRLLLKAPHTIKQTKHSCQPISHLLRFIVYDWNLAKSDTYV